MSSGPHSECYPVILQLSANAAMLTAEISSKESYESCSGAEAAHLYCPDRDRPCAGCALFDSEPDLELISASLPDVDTQQNIDLVLLGGRSGPQPVRCAGQREGDSSTVADYRNRLRYGRRDHSQGHRLWGQGYVDAAASPADFVQAIRSSARARSGRRAACSLCSLNA
jgi:hypothetical protein